MRKQNVAPPTRERQASSDHAPSGGSLNTHERRLLLRASLGLFLRRLNHNLSVSRDDLLRLAYYVDDAPERAA